MNVPNPTPDQQCISRLGCMCPDECRRHGMCMRPVVGAYRDATGELVLPSGNQPAPSQRPPQGRVAPSPADSPTSNPQLGAREAGVIIENNLALRAENERLRAALQALYNNEKYDNDDPRLGNARLLARDALSGTSAVETSESAWLIEMAGERAQPLYWHAEPDARCIGGFDPNPNKAMRFCREKDARAMALMLGAQGMIALTDVRRVKITEHEWPSSEKSSGEPERTNQGDSGCIMPGDTL